MEEFWEVRLCRDHADLPNMILDTYLTRRGTFQALTIVFHLWFSFRAPQALSDSANNHTSR